jgi:hypothetical protein
MKLNKRFEMDSLHRRFAPLSRAGQTDRWTTLRIARTALQPEWTLVGMAHDLHVCRRQQHHECSADCLEARSA